jgi:hypothetical protein
MEANRRNCGRVLVRYNSITPSQVSTHPCLTLSITIKELIGRWPHEERWIGWRGGWELLKRPAMTDLSPESLTEGPLHQWKAGDGILGAIVSAEARDPEAMGEGSRSNGRGRHEDRDRSRFSS